MDGERDRFGSKIQDAEKAREDEWARKQDQELLDRMRHKAADKILCPRCAQPTVAETRVGVALAACPNHHGAWLEESALQDVLKRLA